MEKKNSLTSSQHPKEIFFSAREGNILAEAQLKKPTRVSSKNHAHILLKKPLQSFVEENSQLSSSKESFSPLPVQSTKVNAAKTILNNGVSFSSAVKKKLPIPPPSSLSNKSISTSMLLKQTFEYRHPEPDSNMNEVKKNTPINSRDDYCHLNNSISQVELPGTSSRKVLKDDEAIRNDLNVGAIVRGRGTIIKYDDDAWIDEYQNSTMWNIYKINEKIYNMCDKTNGLLIDIERLLGAYQSKNFTPVKNFENNDNIHFSTDKIGSNKNDIDEEALKKLINVYAYDYFDYISDMYKNSCKVGYNNNSKNNSVDKSNSNIHIGKIFDEKYIDAYMENNFQRPCNDEECDFYPSSVLMLIDAFQKYRDQNEFWNWEIEFDSWNSVCNGKGTTKGTENKIHRFDYRLMLDDTLSLHSSLVRACIGGIKTIRRLKKRIVHEIQQQDPDHQEHQSKYMQELEKIICAMSLSRHKKQFPLTLLAGAHYKAMSMLYGNDSCSLDSDSDEKLYQLLYANK